MTSADRKEYNNACVNVYIMLTISGVAPTLVTSLDSANNEIHVVNKHSSPVPFIFLVFSIVFFGCCIVVFVVFTPRRRQAVATTPLSPYVVFPMNFTLARCIGSIQPSYITANEFSVSPTSY